MKKNIYLILSYISAITVGIYLASQFRFGTPIEDYRWVLTVTFFLMWIVLYKLELKKQ